jgi:hypothetical protein
LVLFRGMFWVFCLLPAGSLCKSSRCTPPFLLVSRNHWTHFSQE